MGGPLAWAVVREVDACECIWAEILVALRTEVSCAVPFGVARYVLSLLLLVLAPAATEHLLEETELGGYCAEEGEEEEGEDAHRGWL